MERFIVVMLTSVAALWAAVPISVAAAPTIEVQASTEELSLGDVLLIDVVASGFVDMYAFQFSLVFDPTRFQVSSLSEGDFLQSAGATFFIPGAFNNAAGLVSYTANTLLGPSPGANGGGLLARFEFDTIAVGVGSFDLEDLLFIDSSVVDVVPSITPVDVNVTSANVPEPSSLLLMIAGLAVVGALKGKRRRPCSSHRVSDALRPGPSHSKFIADESPAFSYGYRHPKARAAAATRCG